MFEIHLTDSQRDKTYVVLLIVAGLFMIGTMYMVGNHIEVFQLDPFRYGAKQLGNVECACQRYTEKGDYLYSFNFNSTSLWTVGLNKNDPRIIGGDGFLQIK